MRLGIFWTLLAAFEAVAGVQDVVAGLGDVKRVPDDIWVASGTPGTDLEEPKASAKSAALSAAF